MRHAFIDSYTDFKTPLHRLNSKLKIILWIAFLLLIILSVPGPLILLYAAIISILAYLSKIPLKFIGKKFLEILPFIVIIALSALFKKGGVALFLNCMIKATLAITLTLIVFSTTKFTQLLQALKEFRIPGLFIYLLSFMYRYSFLLEDEFLRARRAYESRNVSNKNDFKKARIFCNILGAIFIRAYERAERVYLAMCARGYANE